MAVDYYVKELGVIENNDETLKEIPQVVKDRCKELLLSNLELLHNFHSK